MLCLFRCWLSVLHSSQRPTEIPIQKGSQLLTVSQTLTVTSTSNSGATTPLPATADRNSDNMTIVKVTEGEDHRDAPEDPRQDDDVEDSSTNDEEDDHNDYSSHDSRSCEQKSDDPNHRYEDDGDDENLAECNDDQSRQYRQEEELHNVDGEVEDVSYETDTDYYDDDEEEEHDDIQYTMTPYKAKHNDQQSRSQIQPKLRLPVEQITQTPPREEVETVGQNISENFVPLEVHNPDKDEKFYDDTTASIPTASRASTATSSSSIRGRSPTPKKNPPPQHPFLTPARVDQSRGTRASTATASASNSQATHLSSKERPSFGNEADKNTLDSIQVTGGDSIHSPHKQQLTPKPKQNSIQQHRQQNNPHTTSSTSLEHSNASMNGNTTSLHHTPINPNSVKPIPSKSASNNNTTGSLDPLKRRSSHHHRKKLSSSIPRISWKSDPVESFSDWTVNVIYNEKHDGESVDVYHVHRNIVGYGTRKSEYLLRDFRKQLQDLDNNHPSNISHVLLPAARAQVFPMVLDFIYHTKEAKQTLTAERACNVFKVAELLEIIALQKAIADFYSQNLSLKNLGEFLLAASKAKADRLLLVAKAKIGQMITEKPELSGLVPPKFMADILLISRRQLEEARKNDPKRYPEDLVKSQSKYWSKAACICAVQNEMVMTDKLFEELTSEESLPHIDSSIAPKLLSMEQKFSDKTKKDDESLTSLQRRCIASITDDFESFRQSFSTPDACSKTLKELPSNVLAEILIRTMTFSGSQIESV